jgi:hypothetical protein
VRCRRGDRNGVDDAHDAVGGDRHDVGIGAKRGELSGAQARGESAERGGVAEVARETKSALDVIGLRLSARRDP